MKTSEIGIKLIKKYEGCKLKAYLCPAGIPTIGYGNTTYENGSKVKINDVITQERANELFLNLLPYYERVVNMHIKRELNQNEFDALVSFCWNCGSSIRLFMLVNKSDVSTYKWWTTNYIKGGGKVLPGLVKRRKEEADLFIKK